MLINVYRRLNKINFTECYYTIFSTLIFNFDTLTFKTIVEKDVYLNTIF